MFDLDLRLKLLSGSPQNIQHAGLIYPTTLQDICNMGYDNYSQILFLFSLNPDDYINKDIDITQIENMKNINAFDLVVNSGNDELIEVFVKAIGSMFHVKNPYFSLYFQSIFLDYENINAQIENNKLVNRDNFLQIKEFIELTNCIKQIDNKITNNSKAKELQDKFQKSREYVNKVSDKDEQSDLVDIISAVTAKSNSINKFNVWNLTVYQLYDEYKRLDLINQYDLSIESLLHGAKSEEIDLKHWSSKIK